MISISLSSQPYKIGRRFLWQRIRWRGHWTPFVDVRRHYIAWRKPTAAEIHYGKQLESLAYAWLNRNKSVT